MFLKSTSALAVAALLALSLDASAQSRPRQQRQPAAADFYTDAPPLTVKRRSFLDPGPVVPVGSMSNYVTSSTVFGRTEDQTYAKSFFGNESLPAPLEVPGRPVPLVQFATPRVD
jgi:hypothetical protein